MARVTLTSIKVHARQRRLFMAAIGDGAQYELMLEYNVEVHDCVENELMRPFYPNGLEAAADRARGWPTVEYPSEALNACSRFFLRHQSLWIVPADAASVGSDSGGLPFEPLLTPYRRQLKTEDGVVRVFVHQFNGVSPFAPQPVRRPLSQRLDIRVYHQQTEVYIVEDLPQFANLFKVFVREAPHVHYLLKQVYRCTDPPSSFEREVTLLAGLPPHPNIVRLHGLVGSRARGPDADVVLDGMLLTLVDGRNLGTFSEATAVQQARWVSDIRRALDFLHGLSPPRVWGDGKPWNVVISSDDDRAVLVDFGGGATPGWVDAELADTIAGDEQAFGRLVDFIHSLSVVVDSDAPSVAPLTG